MPEQAVPIQTQEDTQPASSSLGSSSASPVPPKNPKTKFSKKYKKNFAAGNRMKYFLGGFVLLFLVFAGGVAYYLVQQEGVGDIRQKASIEWEGPNCDYEDIDKVTCNMSGCTGVPEGCTRGSYYPSEDPDYLAYVAARHDFSRWVGSVQIYWYDTDGGKHEKCTCGQYQIHGQAACNLFERDVSKSGEGIVCDASPTCSKLQLVVTRGAVHYLGLPMTVSVWSRPVLNPYCNTGSVSGVKVTLRNPNSGNKWSAITDERGKATLNPTDDRIYNPTAYHSAGVEDGEYYTLISEKEGYIQSYNKIWFYSRDEAQTEPTLAPPTTTPTTIPSSIPTAIPSPIPTTTPIPTTNPTTIPLSIPTVTPSIIPSLTPTATLPPTQTLSPSLTATPAPTAALTATITPTPSTGPSATPTITLTPSAGPSPTATLEPTEQPSLTPTLTASIDDSQDSSQTTTTQSEEPAELPQAGPKEWLKFLLTGLGLLGAGLSLLLLI